MKQLLRNTYVDNKRVLLRCDLNVPIQNGNIIDDTKIVRSLETIQYLLNKNCKIIILSHLGRVKTEMDKSLYYLMPVKNSLERLLNRPVKFASDILSNEAKQMVNQLQNGEILLLENTRFLDVPNNYESSYNEEVAKEIASLGDIYVFDAFAVAHRTHTTGIGIPKFIPSCLGFLVEKEKNMLDKLLINPAHPFTVIMGGAKVDDKLKIISSLLPKCEHLLVSGGIANSFLSALKLNVGASLKTDNPETIKNLQQMMLTYKDKFAMPKDAIVTTTYSDNPTIKNINKIDTNDVIKDIGTKTIKKYGNIIKESNTIFINGTMGIYEEREFANGTMEIFNLLKSNKEHVVIGGGDTVSAINNLGFKGVFPNISSGGGATLEYIANGSLPGIEAIKEEDNIEVLDL